MEEEFRRPPDIAWGKPFIFIFSLVVVGSALIINKYSAVDDHQAEASCLVRVHTPEEPKWHAEKAKSMTSRRTSGPLAHITPKCG